MMNLGRSIFRFSTWLLALLVLQACGGGSSGSADRYTISANLSDISFQNEVIQANDQSVQVQVSYKGDGLLLGFAPGAQPVAWLKYDIQEVSAERSIINLSVENSIDGGFIPPGEYQTTLRLSTGNTATNELVHHDIDVSLYIWQLILSNDKVAFSATLGAAETSAQTFTIFSDDNAPTSWALSSDVSWLSFSENEGTGSAEITVDADVTGFTQAGLNPATIILTESQTGETKEIMVDLGLDSLRLFADDNAVAFSLLNDTSKLNQQLTISSNAYTQIQWQAETDATWLMITSDVANNTLDLTIDPTIEIEPGFYQSEITISSATAGEAQSDVIPVSFYKADENAENNQITEYLPNVSTKAADPLRPYHYFAVENRIQVYHVYSGEHIGEYPLTIEVTTTDDDGNSTTELQEIDYPLTNFVIHPEGSQLFLIGTETVVDETDPDNPVTNEVTHYYTFDLSDFSFSEIKDTDIQTRPNHITRIDGLYFMVTEAVEFANLSLIRQDWVTDGIYFARDIESAWGANSLFTLDSGATTFRRYVGQANEFLETSLQVELTHEYASETTTEREIPPENEGDDPTIIPASNILSFALSTDEQNLYTISKELDWITFDGETFTDQPLINDEEISRLDVYVADSQRPYFLNLDINTGFYLTIFDQQQQQTSNSLLPVTSANSLLVGHDDNRLILENSGTQTAELVTVAQFNASVEQLNFEAISGENDIASQTVELTGLGSDWQVTSDADWLTVAPASGSGDSTLTISVDTYGLEAGLHTATVTIYDPASGQIQTITVEFAVDENRLFANDVAVAFVSANNVSTLTQTVTMLSNSETVAEWQANTNADWLTLSKTGDELTITADPSGLSDDFYQATISISPADGANATGSEVYVGLTVLAQDIESVDLLGVLPTAGTLTPDPLRPYLYFGIGDEIRIVDIYTGTQVETITGPVADIPVQNFVILSDASKLYFSTQDTDDEGQPITVYHTLDLDTYEITSLDQSLIDINFSPAYATRIAGVDMIVTSALEYTDTNLTTLFWDSSISQLPQAISSPANKDELFVKSGDTIEQFTTHYNGISENKLTVTSASVTQSDNFSSVRDLSISSNGEHIYTSGVDSEWSSYNGDNYTDNGVLHDGSYTSVLTQQVLPDDSFYLYRFDGSALYLTHYDSDRIELSTQNVGTIFPQATYFSGDNKRLIIQGTLLGIANIQLNTIE